MYKLYIIYTINFKLMAKQMTQVIFKMDKELKEQAMKKAKSDGIPFSVVLKKAVEGFVRGTYKIELVGEQPTLNPKSIKMFLKEIEEIKQRKNISPGFKNAEDAIGYLKSL